MNFLLALLLVASVAQESDVVKAANDAKANRTKTTKKVITNADVKKSKTPLGTTNPAPVAPVAPKKSEDEIFHTRVDVEAKLKAAEKKVSDLEKQLVLDEQAYYDEGDSNYRDTVIKSRF